MKTLVVSLAFMTSLVAAPAFAGSVTYQSQPTTPEQKAVAQTIEGMIEAYGSVGKQTQYFTEDIVYLSAGGFGVQPKYEGKMRVGLFVSGGKPSSKHRVDIQSIEVEGDKAIVKGRHKYDVDIGIRILNQDFNTTWKLRKEADQWKVYEWDIRG